VAACHHDCLCIWPAGRLQVQTTYYNSAYVPLAKLQAAPVPFSQKLNAIFYVNSNCKARSGRAQILRTLQQLIKQQNSTLQLHSYGGCDHNVGNASLAELAAVWQAGAGAQVQVLCGAWVVQLRRFQHPLEQLLQCLAAA